jgi:hypothetical protein
VNWLEWMLSSIATILREVAIHTQNVMITGLTAVTNTYKRRHFTPLAAEAEMHRFSATQRSHPAASCGQALLSFTVAAHLFHFFQKLSLLAQSNAAEIPRVVLFHFKPTARAGVLLVQPSANAFVVESMATRQSDYH